MYIKNRGKKKNSELTNKWEVNGPKPKTKELREEKNNEMKWGVLLYRIEKLGWT